jgi:hypothetical protein
MNGAERISAERKRQIDVEGWSPEHDDEHGDRSLLFAAICYAAPVPVFVKHEFVDSTVFKDPWPKTWAWHWDKRHRSGERTRPGGYLPDPSTYSREERIDLLAKAGALIAAEIDRLERAANLGLILSKEPTP